jgi:asparagine synthase (glutamine-hydrolysing)
MCGFVGYFSYSREPIENAERVKLGVQVLRHRGPDAEGVYVGEGIAVGHVRLAFLDITADGNQPFWDSDKRFCIVYNGEIYNFRELREGLVERGYTFRTQSDTEVLLYGLVDSGVEFLKQANGMFAFALYDRQEHTLMLGRDRYGIKPLFWQETTKGILFSSEIRGIRSWQQPKPNERRLAAYLVGIDLPTDKETFLEGVRFYPVGSLGRYGRGIREERSYIRLEDCWSEERRAALAASSEIELVDQFDALLNESVRAHMISDVPVGALCSGGVDSSVILALAAKHSNSLAIFHANVVGPQSELSAARELARHLKLDLVTVDVNDDDFIESFAQVIAHLESPFIYHPNSVPFLKVMSLVAEHRTKAVLTGEGADEILLGYAHIPTYRLIAQVQQGVDSLRSMFHRIPWVGRKLWRSPGNREAELGRDILCGFDGPEAAFLTSSAACTTLEDQFTRQLVTYHLRTLLVRNDRLGMASSIEARFPFLDSDVFAFAINLPRPARMRMTVKAAAEVRHPFVSTKWILRKVADRYLPRTLAFRAKRGFPTNALERMQVSRGFLRDTWLADHYGLDEREADLVEQRASRHSLLRLVMLESWARSVLIGESLQDTNLWVRRVLSFSSAER